jgi:hypothetical protein
MYKHNIIVRYYGDPLIEDQYEGFSGFGLTRDGAIRNADSKLNKKLKILSTVILNNLNYEYLKESDYKRLPDSIKRSIKYDWVVCSGEVVNKCQRSWNVKYGKRTK